PAADMGTVDLHLADEHATLGDLDDPAPHRRFDMALDDQRIAVGNLTLEANIAADDQLAAFLLRILRRHCSGRAGHARADAALTDAAIVRIVRNWGLQLGHGHS